MEAKKLRLFRSVVQTSHMGVQAPTLPTLLLSSPQNSPPLLVRLGGLGERFSYPAAGQSGARPPNSFEFLAKNSRL